MEVVIRVVSMGVGNARSGRGGAFVGDGLRFDLGDGEGVGRWRVGGVEGGDLGGGGAARVGEVRGGNNDDERGSAAPGIERSSIVVEGGGVTGLCCRRFWRRFPVDWEEVVPGLLR